MDISVDEVEVKIKLALADYILSSLPERPQLESELCAVLLNQFGGQYPEQKIASHLLMKAAGRTGDEVDLSSPWFDVLA